MRPPPRTLYALPFFFGLVVSGSVATAKGNKSLDSLSLGDRCQLVQLLARQTIDALEWMDIKKHLDGDRLDLVVCRGDEPQDCEKTILSETESCDFGVSPTFFPTQIQVLVVPGRPPRRQTPYVFLYAKEISKAGRWRFRWPRNQSFAGCQDATQCSLPAETRSPAPELVIEVQKKARELEVTRAVVELPRRSIARGER